MKTKISIILLLINISFGQEVIGEGLYGDDLISFGVSPGKNVGDFLEDIKKQRFLGVISTKKEEVKFIKSMLQN